MWKRYLPLALIVLFCFGLGFSLLPKLLDNINKPSDSPQKSGMKFKKMPKAELAFYRADLEFMKTRDPRTDLVPPGIKTNELKFASRLTQRMAESLDAKQKETIQPLIQTRSWIKRGPNNVSGRLLTVALDVDDENIIQAGSASGGMWRSTNGGKSWVKTTPPNEIQSVSCVVQDKRPGKRDVWYYGTGELLSTTNRKFSLVPRTVGFGNGIFKSTDNGASWQALGSTQISSPDPLNPVGLLHAEVFQGIWNLAIDTTDQTNDIVYVAGYGAIMRSNDGGKTWTVAHGDISVKSFSTDVVITTGGVVYAALSTFSTSGPGTIPYTSGIWRSTDGTNWQNITPQDFPRAYRVIKLALDPSNQNILYVLTENPIPDPNPVYGFTASTHSFWKCTYDDVTDQYNWEDRSQNLPGGGTGNIESDAFNSIGGYALTLRVKPDDENTVFIGGTNLYRSTSAFADAASTTKIGGYPYDFEEHNLHPDQHRLEFTPSDPDVLYSASDGGLFKTNNSTSSKVSWESLNSGLTTTQFYSVAIDPTASNDNLIVGGLQDNATYFTVSQNPEDPWTGVIGGDGLSCTVANEKSFIVGSFYNGNIFTFKIDNPQDSTYYQRPDILTDSDFHFFTNFALDPNSNKTFYLCAKNQLWRKDDMAAAANDPDLLNTGWSELTNAALVTGESITAISVSAYPANRLYYGSDAGKVYRLDDAASGNPAPMDITGDQFPQNGFVACIEVDRHDADRIFVVFSNYSVISIFYSTDGGRTWSNQSGNLEEHPDGSGSGPSVRWLKILHFNDQTIYFAATSIGLFSATELDGTQTVWRQESEDTIGNVIVDMVDARETDGRVVIATQGNGVYSTNVATHSTSAGDDGGCFIATTAYEF